MTTTAKGIPKLSTSSFIKDGPTDVNAALDATDALIDQRGKSIIATTETRTNTAYGLLTTPDRVQNVVLATDGLLAIWYQAQAKVAGTNGRAAIFIGANQLKVGEADGAPSTQAAVLYGNDVYRRLHSGPFGLLSSDSSTDVTDVTTGQVVGSYAYAWSIELNGVIRDATNGAIGITNDGAHSVPSVLGGPVYVFAAAGTYDVSVQFKATSGDTITAKNRKLWVRAVAF